MKIVSWNCNGAFRRKISAIETLMADILVIQECENPATSKDNDYKQWARNYIWTGENKHKGLGIFASSEHTITDNGWENDGTKYFISARINNQFDLIAVWSHHAKSPTFQYIGQFWKYLQINKYKLSEAIIAGDFNSNKKWDKSDRWWNHSDVVRELEEINIRSLYHEFYRYQQGEEQHPTFFLHKSEMKPYHIDYIFAHSVRFPHITNFEIGDATKWLSISDHLPIIAVV